MVEQDLPASSSQSGLAAKEEQKTGVYDSVQVET